MTPKHAQLLAGDLDDETLVRYIDRFLMFYIRTADRLQRTAPWVEQLDGGLDHLRDVVCNDSLGPGRRVRRRDGPPRRRATRANGRACWRTRQAVAVRLVRQRARRRGSHRRRSPNAQAARCPSGCRRSGRGAEHEPQRHSRYGPPACAYDHLIPCRGVGVLLPDGAQAALFRLDDGTVHAVGNIDPFSGAAVMSRGIVGDRGGRATVQSPIKQAFALDDGTCLDDPATCSGVPEPGHRRTAWRRLRRFEQGIVVTRALSRRIAAQATRRMGVRCHSDGDVAAHGPFRS